VVRGCCCPTHHSSTKRQFFDRVRVRNHCIRTIVASCSHRATLLNLERAAQISRLPFTRTRASLVASQRQLQQTFRTGGSFIGFMTIENVAARERALSGRLCRLAMSDPENATTCYVCMHLLLYVHNSGISSFGEHICIPPLPFLRASANHFAFSMQSVQHPEQSYQHIYF
jgi:hypothetical protein